jgi:lysosomal acid lipase/cholesteryl ester hydrolase
MNNYNFKNLILFPYKTAVKGLNYIQDKFSPQEENEMYTDIKIKEEIKEEKMNFEELVMSKGFPLEIHYAETEDGFMLKLYRIPGGKGELNYRKKKKQSVLLMHGIFDSSDGWVCNEEDKCIPFILANLGYDIWLGNTRGNKHSRYHKKFKDDDPEMWNFSFNEMGLYDLPAFLTHITGVNNFSEKVVFIGHSQGTAQLFAGLTQSLEFFKSKIKLFIALAPVARVSNMTSLMLNLMKLLKIDLLFEKLAFYEVLAHDCKLEKFSSWIMPKIPLLCSLIINHLGDTSSSNNNKKMMPVYLSHVPGGSSLKAVSHFVQLSRNSKFQMYDYGKELNKVIYNCETPKEYDLKTIHDLPIALFYGQEDKLSHSKDVEWLISQLGENVVYQKEYSNMGHATFLMANDIDVLEYYKLFNHKYEKFN